MTSKILLEVLRKIITVFKKSKTKIVFMGGIATSVFGRPRATYDVDGFILIEKSDLAGLLSRLAKAGFKHDKKQPFKSIRGMSFITLIYSKLKTYVDLFIASSEFHRNILERARSVKVDGLKVPLVSPEDLVLLKLVSGRERDLEDVREILAENKGKIDFPYLKKWAKALEVDLFLKDELESLY